VNWTVRVAADVLARIAIWNRVYPGLGQLIHERLFVTLRGDPDTHLGEQIVPLTARVSQFNFPENPPVPAYMHFIFAVDRRDDIHELHVIAGRMTSNP
jgi:hypothetical protein